jgi:hypothetical protein
MDRIVCAALLFDRGEIILGARHYDGLMVSQLEDLRMMTGRNVKNPPPIQGFINQRGEFLNRTEALAVAQAAGQIIEKTWPKDILFSEDLY